MRRIYMRSRRHIAVLVVTAFLATSTASADHKQLKPGFNLFSKEQDIQLGREAAAQVESQMRVVRDPQITAYVQQMGRRLIAHPQADRYPYSFKVIDDPSINAFALPGGATYVHTGLLRAADNEAQLAGVMAHEIAHVALRHGTNQASKANLIQLPAMLAGAIAGGSGSILGQLAQLGIGLGANSVLLKFSRGAESDADLLGAKLMAEAGYNPLEMARFFEKLEAQGGRTAPQFLSSHPNPGNRRKAIEQEVQTFARRSYSEGASSELAAIKSRLGRMDGVQTRARTGDTTRPSVSASGDMRELRSQSFSLSYPANWQVFGDSNSGMVTIAPREGVVQARNGRPVVAFGLIASFYHPRYDDSKVDLERDSRDLVTQLQSGNPSLRAEGNARRLRVDADEALMITFESDSPVSQRGETDVLLTVARPEGLFYLVLVAPTDDFQRYRSVFDAIVRSVRFRN
jgi:predicted Zn-dependent protease